MNLFFLQVLIDSTKIKDSLATVAQAAAQQKQNLWDILVKGGPLMVPLAIVLVIAIFFFFERYIAIKKASRMDDNFMSIIRDHIVNGNIQAARSLSKNTDTAVAKMIDKGIQRIGKPIEAIERSMENVGKLELYKMEKNTSILSMVGYIGPLFGFLGTIAGMLQLFYDIANSPGDYGISNIAAGIYVKMVSSATGLIIGIIGYLMYRYCMAQIDKATNRMEVASADFIDILQEPTR
ncbi:MAG TPA: MotA/TolQ/ExbB proton channel family protein [Puia sp.]|jgi:biopolymer transport protein ExbB|nr:MotA/TolQ/ExbB proton channel family protein [Puia sp.]